LAAPSGSTKRNRPKRRMATIGLPEVGREALTQHHEADSVLLRETEVDAGGPKKMGGIRFSNTKLSREKSEKPKKEREVCVAIRGNNVSVGNGGKKDVRTHQKPEVLLLKRKGGKLLRS